MQIAQIYDIVNDITTNILGGEIVLNEDLSNVVDIGTELENLDHGYDNFIRQLPDRIAKVIFVDRVYSGRAPSVLMDAFEYGAIVQKISTPLPEATENETWELEDGASYDPNVFYASTIEMKFFRNKTTFEIPISIADRQVKTAFTGATELNAFMSMLYNAISNSMTIKMDALVERTINNMIASTFNNDISDPTDYGRTSTNRCVNLLKLYNDSVDASEAITADTAVLNGKFIRFASLIMANYMDRMKVMNKLFNVGGKARFTPNDKLHVVMLSEFKNAADIYLQSDTFHDEYTRLPNAESVAYWQGPGEAYAFEDTSKIDVTIKTADGSTSVQAGGILAIMFDRDALGVTNLDRRVTSNYNPKAEFTNTWTKFDAGYFNDLNEQFVVFFIADTGE